MVITNNIIAMNAQRQFNTVGRKKAKSTEKLSSGYRINRAADDAAGLTISEKMRSQIRGLSQGVENTQDGISMCQIADGALEEVHDMIHRITELSVKASNETNTAADRQAIQSEINDILAEIDRISESTEFNTLPIFKEGSNNRISGNAKTTSDSIQLSINDNSKIYSEIEYTYKTENVNVITDSEATDSGFTSSTYVQSPEENRKYNQDHPISYEITETGKSTNIPGIWENKGDKIYAYYIYGVDREKVARWNDDVSEDGWYVFKRNYGDGLNCSNVVEAYKVTDFIKITNGTPSVDPVYADDSLYSSSAYGFTHYEDRIARVLNGLPGALENNYTEMDYSGRTFSNFGRSKDNNMGIGRDNSTFNKSLQLKTNSVLLVHGGASEETITGWFEDGDYSVSGNYIIDSDEFNDKWGISYTGTPKTGDKISLTVDKDENYYNKRFWIQSGAQAGNGLYLEFGNMNTKVLGINRLNVSTATGARNAIETSKNAVDKVSKIRSEIGAQQNRLEHTVANENNIVENTTAAETRIRDTDMAKEVANQAVQSILTQAGISMMAQANQSTQGVLQLLQ